MGIDKEGKDSREIYEKPRLRTIELIVEEVLAAGCKNHGHGNPTSPVSCMANNCSHNAS